MFAPESHSLMGRVLDLPLLRRNQLPIIGHAHVKPDWGPFQEHKQMADRVLVVLGIFGLVF